MNSIEFAYWLKGFFELSQIDSQRTLNETQVQIIKEHLDLVFEKNTSTTMQPSGLGISGFSSLEGRNGTC